MAGRGAELRLNSISRHLIKYLRSPVMGYGMISVLLSSVFRGPDAHYLSSRFSARMQCTSPASARTRRRAVWFVRGMLGYQDTGMLGCWHRGRPGWRDASYCVCGGGSFAWSAPSLPQQRAREIFSQQQQRGAGGAVACTIAEKCVSRTFKPSILCERKRAGAPAPQATL